MQSSIIKFWITPRIFINIVLFLYLLGYQSVCCTRDEVALYEGYDRGVRLYYLYEKGDMKCYREMFVSIHLMLLFIGDDLLGVVLLDKFPYITCYCLSTVHSR